MRVGTKGSTGGEGKDDRSATTEIWREMVYNKDITNTKVMDGYKNWANGYDQDFAIVHPNSKTSVNSASIYSPSCSLVLFVR